MAYDSKTYGQSPFGNPKKPSGSENAAENSGQAKSVPNAGFSPTQLPIDDGLDKGPGEIASAPVKKTSPASTLPNSVAEAPPSTFPKSLQPNIPPAVSRLAGRLGLGKSPLDGQSATGSEPTSARKSRTTTKTATKPTAKSASKSTRKSKKTKAAEAARAEAEAAEAASARRFQIEDRNAYLSLLYKTGISFLIWAVLRLSRQEFSEDADAVINIIIHPLLISSVALIAVVAMTFWLRYLLNDLAQHTRQLSTDAEETSGKNYRPTLDIVGAALEYNPALRKNLALFWHAASILICTLISYLITSTLLP